MRNLIYALGALLVACGLGFFAFSIDLIGIERGTAYATSGATLVGAGVVTIAIGRVAQLVERIAASASAPAPVAETPKPPRGADAVALAAAQAEAALAQTEGAAPVDIPAAPKAASPAPPAEVKRTPVGGDAARVEAVAAKGADATTKAAGDAVEGRAAAASAATAAIPPVTTPAPAASPKADAVGSKKPHEAAPVRPVATAAPRVEQGPGGLDPFPAAQPTSEPMEPKASRAERRVVGRYQANGVDYALFSDGSIEAERNGAKQRFASLSELKSFIEQG